MNRVAHAARLLPKVSRIDAARFHAATARLHLTAGRRTLGTQSSPPAGGRLARNPHRRPADAWHAIRTADRLAGPRPSFEQYALEAHAGIREVCLTLLELDGHGGSSPGGAGDPDPVELRATAAPALHRLRRYARTFPMARPRALICLGWSAWLDGRARAARRAWARAVREAEHLERALAGFQAAGATPTCAASRRSPG